MDEKNRQLRRMEKSMRETASSVDELKVRYLSLQKDVSEYDGTQQSKFAEQLQEKIERYEVEIEQYQKLAIQRLAESIRLNGGDAERKLEEMNRQMIAERLRNLQLMRKLQTIERNRADESTRHAKLQKSYEEQRFAHVKQLKIASYELDLTAIEIARLQTVLLHSVPRTDYDELLTQHKQLLVTEDSYKEKDYVGINLLKEMADETEGAELAVENTHLKEVIKVLTSQNEFWQAELDKIRAQNQEMTLFLEDIESESQVKSLLVALERRFLEALSQCAHVSQNQKLAAEQMHNMQNEFTRKRRSWNNEKKKLIEVIRSLQRLLLVHYTFEIFRNRPLLPFFFQRIRSNSMEIMTVQQMLQYKEKVAEVNANYAKSEQCKNEIERIKEEQELQLRNAEALRRSFELLQENDYNIIKLQKSLQANQLNLLNSQAQLQDAQLQIQKRDERIQKQEDKISGMQREIQDLFAATFKIPDLDEKTGESHEQLPASATATLGTEQYKTPDLEEPEAKQPRVRDIEDEDMNADSGLDDTKTYLAPEDTVGTESDAQLSPIPAPRAVDTTSNISAISKEYEAKLRHIRETAELCIENYKACLKFEQLKYKEEVIEKYKTLLKMVFDERDGSERRIDASSLLAAENPEMRKLRTSTEILQQDAGADAETKELEIIKLKNEIEHFIEVNRELTDKMVKIQKQASAVVDATTQTDADEEEMDKEKRISSNQPSISSGSEKMRKLRTSTEILQQDAGADAETKELEIIKLKNEIEHFIKVNRELTDKMVRIQKQASAVLDAATQTDADEEKMDKEKSSDQPSISSSSESEVVEKSEEESTKAIVIPGPLRLQTPPPERTRSIAIELSDAREEVLMETLRKEESTVMVMRMEIRKLKQRIATLNARNKELQQACETIRAEALSQIERSYVPDSADASEATITRLQEELAAVKKEAANQKSMIREQKEIIEQLQGAKKLESAKNAEAEVAKWRERKAREGNIEALRKKLKESEQREHEMREKLEKRERHIEQINRTEGNRVAEVERLRAANKKLKHEIEVNRMQQNKADDCSKGWEETNRVLHQKVEQLKKVRKKSQDFLANPRQSLREGLSESNRTRNFFFLSSTHLYFSDCGQSTSLIPEGIKQ
ncbi:unnamed protein product [Gongylonema pulchrum]|uniref:Uncharacterized protein n=1 Tax=Gongylonema pulchrum TaxID=637853 RepID=A0A3P7Q246_9BILA|nr:unnamed protein product [Gongylonema pulchrum]